MNNEGISPDGEVCDERQEEFTRYRKAVTARFEKIEDFLERLTGLPINDSLLKKDT